MSLPSFTAKYDVANLTCALAFIGLDYVFFLFFFFKNYQNKSKTKAKTILLSVTDIYNQTIEKSLFIAKTVRTNLKSLPVYNGLTENRVDHDRTAP